MAEKIVSLSSLWTEEINKVPPNFYKDRFQNLVAVLHTSDVLLEALNKKKLNPVKMKPLDFICMHYFAHAYNLATSIFYLCKNGMGSSCIILIRALLESLINCSYLWLCKKINGNENERNAWMEYEYIERSKMSNLWSNMQKNRQKINIPLVQPNDLFTQEKRNELSVARSQFKLKYGSENWAVHPNVDERARRVDSCRSFYDHTGIFLEEDYVTIYKWASELVHGSPASASSFIDESFNCGLQFEIGASKKNIDIILPICTRIMIGMLFLLNHIYHLDVDLTAQLRTAGLNKVQDRK
ncbi:hypothetical protein PM3016_5417 [Paenibacillus mucilaginosus 3016]|uniref:Uncharacterized protein n=1 Tax=Paenibacillus mucilaginosus 3016 TaxID=1116391 RepID=H6NDR8_9BACL|nr:DUF5677 domain-containing protein [Paenibacillus mucilaginosus]AFC32117.1 hypothetical protein PM3016_5417 [Paenibacillus mucilaginosus 3016]WFA20621.1 hypothetical protein ERY13_26970 [Paenibacillus mucilaginosus]